MKKTIEIFNRIDPWIPLFLIPCIYFLGFTLNYNEEQYFGYAKAFMDRTWMNQSFVFSDFPGSRIVFQWLSGFLLRYMSFEQLAFWGRLVGFILLAFPLVALARHFKLNSILTSFWIIALYIPQQNFFGGEWIYGGFESKTISYVFVLWSLVFILRNKLFLSIIFAGFSVQWHLLAGGWYSLYLFIFLIPGILNNWRIIVCWSVFGIMILPLFIYLYNGLFSGSQPIINGVNIASVYSNIRNPHHIGLFSTPGYFISRHAGKIALAVISLLVSVFIYGKILPDYLKPVNRLLIIILAQNLLFVIIAYFDKNGVIMKTYPFRGSSLSMILFQMETLFVLRKNLIPFITKHCFNQRKTFFPGRIYRFQMASLLTAALIIAGLKITERIHKYHQDVKDWKNTDLIAKSIKQNSNPRETFLNLCPENKFILSLPRKAERDSYFIFRFIPTDNDGIYEWDVRRQVQVNILRDPGSIKNPRNNMHASLVLSCSGLNLDFVTLISNSGPYYLYRIN